MANNSDPNCLFCKIVAGEIKATVVSEGDAYIAIRDINPQAPTHILILSRLHLPDITAVADAGLLGRLFQAACAVAKQERLPAFRLVVNTGSEAGQSVFHLHIHLLGGRPMHWPPG